MADTWLVVGLGNPGPGYAAHRHNVGQMVADEVAARIRSSFGRARSGRSAAHAVVAEGFLAPGGPKLILAKPLSYMNESGGPVSQLVRFFDIPPERLIVVHDELDVPFDSVRLKTGGGHGGHNGIRSIAQSLGTPDFTRVRVGIGRPPGRQDPADFVLRPFSTAERAELANLVADAADAVELTVTDGLLAAQQRYHSARD